MYKTFVHTIGASLALSCGAAAFSSALAMDPVCTQVMNAMHVLKTTPMHIYMTQTQNFSNATIAKAGAQIGIGGTKQTEEISTTKDVYVLTDGKWVDMQISFAAMEDDKDADLDTKKALDEAKCKTLPDEAVSGQPASVYLQNIPGLDIVNRLWVSKVSNRPIRSETTSDQGGMKTLTVSRYEYSDVQAPAHTVPMSDMAKSR